MIYVTDMKPSGAVQHMSFAGPVFLSLQRGDSIAGRRLASQGSRAMTSLTVNSDTRISVGGTPTCNPKYSVEHIHPIVFPVGDSSAFQILPVSFRLLERVTKLTWADKINSISLSRFIQCILSMMLKDAKSHQE